MRPFIVKITRDPNSTIVLLKMYSVDVRDLRQSLIAIFSILNVALEYKGRLVVTQEQSFPEIEGDEKIVVQVQMHFDTNQSIDEFIQFIMK